MENIINNPYLAATAILAVLDFLALVILSILFQRYRTRQKALLAGEEIGSLEEIVLKHKKTLSSHNKNLKELGKILEELVEHDKLNIQRVGVVRFNPFADTGANMSFTIALLDAYDNGIVISSLHSREGTRIYAKPVKEGKSSYSLTEEEKSAITQANQGNKLI